MTWPYLISVCCLLFCCFAFLYFRSFIKKRTSFEGTIKDVREEISRLLRSLDEITDKNITLIEDREKRLKELLEETDRRLTIYSREMDRRENAERTYREMGSRIIHEPPKAASMAPAPPPVSQPVSHPVSHIEEVKLSLEEQIRELAGSGISPEIIASRLGISISEAELAVALEARKGRG